jgi:glycerophosphoryl diester phosphodiesterase
MGLLDGLEKLINEHGSATILKERIELANDKCETLLEKNKVLEQKITQLEAEIENLKANTKITDDSNLEEIKANILSFLLEHEEVPSDLIGRAPNQNVQVITFHLDELDDLKLINPTYIMNSPVLWSLAHQGRRNLINHGLLK